MNETQTKLLTDIETMIPLYRGKNIQALEAPVKNIEWNIGKLRKGTLDIPTWANYTKGDFAHIAGALKADEAGQSFAVAAGARIDAAFPVAGVAKAAPATAASTSRPANVESQASSKASTAMPGQPGQINVNAFLSDKAGQQKEKLEWETSVVDLLKLLGADSSLAERKKIAKTVGMSDSEVASIGSEEGNAALHSRLLQTLASNQGQLPTAIA